MIAILELEVFTASPQLKIELRGNAPWVAEITGLNNDGKFLRRFLQGDTDYTRANSVGSRGVHKYYHLRSGRIYEVAERLTWKRTIQYFCRVDDQGEIVRVERKAVLDLFQGARSAAVPALRRGLHG